MARNARKPGSAKAARNGSVSSPVGTGRFVSRSSTSGTFVSRVPRDSGRSIPSTADPITDGQRASAARIRMLYDQRVGRDTEAWIKKIAGQS